MRIHVRSTTGINPIDFTQVGAAYTDEPENFVNWLERYCPGSDPFIDLRMKPGEESDWKAYVRFNFRNPKNRKVFLDKWGGYGEKVDES